MKLIIHDWNGGDVVRQAHAADILLREGTKDVIVEFTDKSVWFAKLTKTGVSVRPSVCPPLVDTA